MNDTEQLVKEALGKLAERTPHPGPTLNALRRKHKRHRNVFLIATAGMAAVAVLIFAGLVTSNRYQPPNPDDAAAALIADRAKAQSVPLKYAPHWLPDGFVENFRTVGDETSRVWVPASLKERNPTEQTGDPRVSLHKIKKLPDDLSKWQEVTVSGLKAWALTFQGQSPGLTTDLVWQAQDALRVTVRNVENTQDVAVRVASSVRADPKIAFLPPFWLDGRPATEVWGSSAYHWNARWISEKFGVTVSTSAPVEVNGTPVTVRGRQGALVGNGVAVVVRDSSGFWILVEGSAADQKALVDMADRIQLQIVPTPDTIWIGQGV